MKIALGTSSLGENFNDDYWNMFKYFLNNSLNIHSYENYKYTDQYFQRAYNEGLPGPKIITKILINKNPIKKIINIQKQIKLYKEKYKTKYSMQLQLCNNPHYNFINQFFLKKIIIKEKKNINKIYLDCFYNYSPNIEKIIDEKIYDGIICTFNLFYRGVNFELINKLKNLNKKIIAISPFASGNLDYEEFILNQETKVVIKKLLLKYQLTLYEFNLAFLNNVGVINEIVIGTKKFGHFQELNEIIKKTKNVLINQQDMETIFFRLQKPF